MPWYEDALVNTPDIIGLPDLQEATLLWTLRERYAQQAIYVCFQFKKKGLFPLLFFIRLFFVLFFLIFLRRILGQ